MEKQDKKDLENLKLKVDEKGLNAIESLEQERNELLEALKIAELYLHNADRELRSGKTLRQIVNQAIKKATE